MNARILFLSFAAMSLPACDGFAADYPAPAGMSQSKTGVGEGPAGAPRFSAANGQLSGIVRSVAMTPDPSGSYDQNSRGGQSRTAASGSFGDPADVPQYGLPSHMERHTR